MNKGLIVLSLFALLLLQANDQALRPGIGDKAPDISLPNIDGDTLRLSDMQGHLVLLDFWASWCKRCRVDNQHYKQLLKRYQDSSFRQGNGLRIFSVSLDTDSALWRSAVEGSKLNWPQQVSDGQGWNSPYVDSYSIKYLPHNLLLDSSGTVIAKGIHGKSLNTFLKDQHVH